MSTPELKPETPITDAFFNRKPSGRPFLTEARETMTKLESALNAAREAIEEAPHDLDCQAQKNAIRSPGFKKPCDCWKAEALAQIFPQQSKTT